MKSSFERYIDRLNKRLRDGDATEHSFRSDLERLLKEVGGWEVEVTNEPARRIACGAPDFSIKNAGRIAGFIETKAVGKSLDKEEKTGQIKRYRRGLGNLILTDYLEFRWYLDGEPQMTAHLGGYDPARNRVRGVADTAAFDTLLSMFLDAEAHAPTIADPRELARRMAERTRLIRDTIFKALEEEVKQAEASGESLRHTSLHAQLTGFREVLLQEFSRDDFADIYAQTISYGMFTARFHKKPGEEFTREVATFRMPPTNPFLSKTFARLGGAELDDRVTWVVDDLARILDRTDIAAIQRQFRGHTRRDDPVVHFYERFLAEYAPDIRERRGVYYTPGPVVDYIVRSVDAVLKRDFGLERGLADEGKVEVPQPGGGTAEEHRVQILDPAAGTGTFLFSILDLLYHDYFKGLEGLWPEYVRDQLLPRLFGFELLMAPYAIAHLKLNLKLQETFCALHGGERINLFLTNALEEPHDLSNPPMFTQWLKEEAEAANRVKRERPVMVVLGNPPYSGESMNPSEREVFVPKGHVYETYANSYFAPQQREATKDRRVKQRTFIGHLLRGWDPVNRRATESYFHVAGRPLGEKNPKWLNDDYVKFIRFAQWRIARTGHGVLGFVTNHGYLDNPTFRGMRESLMRDFDAIYVLDLHGSTKKKETPPEDGRDENVFDIQQGVAILLCVKQPDGRRETCTVRHADLWGPRNDRANDPEAETAAAGGKYGWLASHDVTTTEWTEIKPQGPQYYFSPHEEVLFAEYCKGHPLDAIFPINTVGFQTHRDHFAVAFEKDVIMKRISDLRDDDLSDDDIASMHNVKNNRDWKINKIRKHVLENENWKDAIIECAYRPFDERYCYFSYIAMDYPRRDLMDHMYRKENLCLLSSRQQGATGYCHCFVADKPANDCVVSAYSREANQVFMLYKYKVSDELDLYDTANGATWRHPNIDTKFVNEIKSNCSLAFLLVGSGDLDTTFGPEDVLAYVYAILHAPGYRARYGEYLRRDFPRIPPPPGRALFAALCGHGHRLIALHLLRAEPAGQPGFPVAAESPDGSEVEAVRYVPSTAEHAGRVYINARQYFDGVPQAVWDFHVGGYQVCEKWLKDRKGRALSYADIRTYRRIVAALGETLTLMSAIDRDIDAHGGWPMVPPA